MRQGWQLTLDPKWREKHSSPPTESIGTADFPMHLSQRLLLLIAGKGTGKASFEILIPLRELLKNVYTRESQSSRQLDP